MSRYSLELAEKNTMITDTVNIMYDDLPEELQAQIMRHLQADEFIKAKELMDEYRAMKDPNNLSPVLT